jgi:hypothetical protein
MFQRKVALQLILTDAREHRKTKTTKCREKLLMKIDRQSERLEKQKEERESLREVRKEEYWSVEKVTDGSAFAYGRQQL